MEAAASLWTSCPAWWAGSAQVHVARLAADGMIGRHPASAAQIFAVLSGAGEVAGAAGVRRRIVASQADVG